MKKLLILSAAILICASLTNAQTNEAFVKNDIKNLKKDESLIKKQKHSEKNELRKLESTQVSPASKKQFSMDFPNLENVNWDRTTNFDRATFTKDNQICSAFYDDKGDLVGATTMKKFEDLPTLAQNEIQKKYKDYTLQDVVFFDDNEYNETGMVIYNQQFPDEDNYFVVLNKGNDKIVLQVSLTGSVSFFTRLN